MKPRVLVWRSELLPLSETFIAAQAGALRRWEPHFFGVRRLGKPLLLQGSSVLCVGDRLPGESGIFRAFGQAPALLSAARACKAALLHAHFAVDAAELLPLRRRLGLPLLVTLHGYDVMRTDEAHRATRRGRLYLERRKELWQETALFLCVSDAIRREAMARGFPARKLRVLPLGVDTEALVFQHELPCSPTVLFVGRLVPKKGCRVLIEAMARLQQSMPSAQLRIVGDGPERADLEQAAAAQTIGTGFLGAMPPEQVRAEMLAARCLAAPSLRAADGDAEGLPIALCEALALGVPVVSTRHSGIPELITHEIHGLLSREGDAEAFAENLLAVLSGQAHAQRLRIAGRAHVESSFNLHRQTAALESCYDEFAVTAAPQTTGITRHSPNSPTASERPGRVPIRLPAQMQEGKGAVPQGRPFASGRLRHQAAWLLCGNGAATVFQALAFLLVGRLLGAAEYGALIGMVALVNVLSQFSSLGMEMVLLRTIARDRAAFAFVWGRALLVSGCGFFCCCWVSCSMGTSFCRPRWQRCFRTWPAPTPCSGR